MIMAVAMIIGLFSFAFNAAAATNWDVTVEIRDNQGNIKNSDYNVGDMLTFQFNLWTTSTITGNETFTYYVNQDLFDLSSDLAFQNPTLQTGGTDKIFSDTSFTSYVQETIDGQSFRKYTLAFSQATKDYLLVENITNIKFTMFARIDATLKQTKSYVPIMIKDENNFELYKGNIDIEIPECGDDGIPSVTKNMRNVYRKVNDTYVEMSNQAILQDGDIVYFEVVASSPYSASTAVKKNVILDKLYDILPRAYTLMSVTTTAVNRGNQTVTLTNGPMTFSASGFADSFGTWVVDPSQTGVPQGSTRCIMDIQPDYVMPPSPATYGSSLRVPLFAVYHAPEAGSSWTENDVKNTAYAHNPDGLGGQGTFTPETDPSKIKYDMSLSCGISDVFNSDHNSFSFDKNSPQLTAGSTILVSLALYNQGTEITKNNKVYLYLPAGLELDSDSYYNGAQEFRDYNSGWKKVTGLTAPADFWGTTYTVYEKNSEMLRYPGDVNYLNDLTVALKVLDGKQPIDYYVAAEIVSFQNVDGKSTDDADGIEDWDSTPDGNPCNDLISNVDGAMIYPINSGTKEIQKQIQQHAKTVTDKLQDEDDFDFAFVKLLKPEIVTDDVMLDKKRITTDIEGSFNQIRGTSASDGYFKNLTPVPADGKIMSTDKYLLYDIWINRNGSETTYIHNEGGESALGSRLVDELPPGLKLATDSTTGLPLFYGMQLTRYYGVPWLHDSETNQDYISYTTGMYGSETLSIDKNAAGIPALYMDKKISRYGMEINVSENGRKLELVFGNGEGIAANLQNTDFFRSAFRLRLIVTIDPENINYDTIFKNTATYEYHKEKLSSSEETEEFWGLNSATAYCKKYVKNSATGNWISGSSANLLKAGDKTVEYKIRFRSAGGFKQNEISILDNILPEANIESITGLKVEGYSGSDYQSDGELVNPAALEESEYAIQAVQSGNTITISNPDKAIPAKQLYNITFKVTYKDLVPGMAIKNAVLGSEVVTYVPLTIGVCKVDGTTSTPLKGYQFNVYYAGIDGKADKTKPVFDIHYKNAVLKDSGINGETPVTSFDFRPTDYDTAETGATWTLVFVETKTPTGYGAELNKEYPVTVTKLADGSLSIADVNGTDLSAVTNSADPMSVCLTMKNYTDNPQRQSLLIRKTYVPEITPQNPSALNYSFKFRIQKEVSGSWVNLTTAEGVDADSMVAVQVSWDAVNSRYFGETALNNLENGVKYRVGEAIPENADYTFAWDAVTLANSNFTVRNAYLEFTAGASGVINVSGVNTQKETETQSLLIRKTYVPETTPQNPSALNYSFKFRIQKEVSGSWVNLTTAEGVDADSMVAVQVSWDAVNSRYFGETTLNNLENGVKYRVGESIPENADYTFAWDAVTLANSNFTVRNAYLEFTAGASGVINVSGVNTQKAQEEDTEKTQASGKKIWVHGPAAKPTVTVALYIDKDGNGSYSAGDEAVPDKEVTLTYPTVDYTFLNLPKYDDDQNLIVYVVRETVVPPSYSQSYNGMDVTNTYQPSSETTEVSGQKVWSDQNDKYDIRPDSITVNLYRDGVKVDSVVVKATDSWKFSFKSLLKYNQSNGAAYVYTVDEVPVKYYIKTVNGYTITNTLNPDEINSNEVSSGDKNQGSSGASDQGIGESSDSSTDETTSGGSKGKTNDDDSEIPLTGQALFFNLLGLLCVAGATGMVLVLSRRRKGVSGR